MKRIKPEKAYAIVCWMGHDRPYEFAFTWDKKHPEDKVQKSQKVFAIYPTKTQALQDRRFRGGDIIEITLKGTLPAKQGNNYINHEHQ